MNSFYLTVFLTLWGSLSAFSIPGKEANNPTLKLLHVLFRHGDRNPDSSSLIKGSPYYDESFYPEGYGQLTNNGKRTEHKIGTQLRRSYNDFLTDTWNINYLDVRSTNTDRTKMSVELMLAALYPPRRSQIWSLLNWQPIPYNYYVTSEDKETQAWSACSTRFYTLMGSVCSSPEIVAYLTRYDELFSILTNKSGSTATIFSAFNYYFGFAVQSEIGYPLEEWTEAIYPEPIHSAAVDFYYVITNTTEIRRLTAGFLLRKILSDTQAKINGTISPSDRKMFIYSAHEMNVGSMILSLDAFKLADIPAYGSYIVFEVHEIDGVWGIKLFYQDYENDNPHPVKLPGCDYFCPYDDFYNLVEEILPTDDIDCSA